VGSLAELTRDEKVRWFALTGFTLDNFLIKK